MSEREESEKILNIAHLIVANAKKGKWPWPTADFVAVNDEPTCAEYLLAVALIEAHEQKRNTGKS